MVSRRAVRHKRTFQTRLHFCTLKRLAVCATETLILSTKIFLLYPLNVYPAIFLRSPLFWEGMPEPNNKMPPTSNMDLICTQSVIFKDRVTRVGRFTTTTNSSVCVINLNECDFDSTYDTTHNAQVACKYVPSVCTVKANTMYPRACVTCIVKRTVCCLECLQSLQCNEKTVFIYFYGNFSVHYLKIVKQFSISAVCITHLQQQKINHKDLTEFPLTTDALFFH